METNISERVRDASLCDAPNSYFIKIRQNDYFCNYDYQLSKYLRVLRLCNIEDTDIYYLLVIFS